MIEIVLATDLAKSFDIVNKFQLHVQASADCMDWENKETKSLALQMVRSSLAASTR